MLVMQAVKVLSVLVAEGVVIKHRLRQFFDDAPEHLPACWAKVRTKREPTGEEQY